MDLALKKVLFVRARSRAVYMSLPPNKQQQTNKQTALAQGVIVRTSSRDTIYQAEISSLCDEPAPRHSEALTSY